MDDFKNLKYGKYLERPKAIINNNVISKLKYEYDFVWLLFYLLFFLYIVLLESFIIIYLIKKYLSKVILIYNILHKYYIIN